VGKMWTARRARAGLAKSATILTPPTLRLGRAVVDGKPASPCRGAQNCIRLSGWLCHQGAQDQEDSQPESPARGLGAKSASSSNPISLDTSKQNNQRASLAPAVSVVTAVLPPENPLALALRPAVSAVTARLTFYIRHR
jgi:hypothetical protein